MPVSAAHAPKIETLQDVTRAVETAEGFHAVIASLLNGRGALVDGVWGSSGSVLAAALGRHAPSTVLVVIAHPRELDSWVEDIASFSGNRPIVFPAWDALPGQEEVLDDVWGQRLRILRHVRAAPAPRFVMTTLHA